jgi:hypothetical protein
MFKKPYQHLERAQGLVEYVLIIVLVAIAAALILGAIRWTTQRGFVGGALGAKPKRRPRPPSIEDDEGIRLS